MGSADVRRRGSHRGVTTRPKLPRPDNRHFYTSDLTLLPNPRPPQFGLSRVSAPARPTPAAPNSPAARGFESCPPHAAASPRASTYPAQRSAGRPATTSADVDVLPRRRGARISPPTTRPSPRAAQRGPRCGNPVSKTQPAGRLSHNGEANRRRVTGRAMVDIRCAATQPGPRAPRHDCRCQLLAGHEGPHAVMFTRAGRRMVRTWRAQGPATIRDQRVDQPNLPWVPGMPVPAWRDSV